MSMKTISKASAIALAFGLLAGCATTDGNLSAQVADAQQQAAEALRVANDASAKADAAMNAANEAKEMASRAEGVAKAAEFGVSRIEKRQEQMFKKSMYK